MPSVHRINDVVTSSMPAMTYAACHGYLLPYVIFVVRITQRPTQSELAVPLLVTFVLFGGDVPVVKLLNHSGGSASRHISPDQSSPKVTPYGSSGASTPCFVCPRYPQKQHPFHAVVPLSISVVFPAELTSVRSTGLHCHMSAAAVQRLHMQCHCHLRKYPQMPPQ